MRWEVVRRGAAIGVVFGIAAAAETLRGVPALRAGPDAIVSALELAALVVGCYAAIGVAGGALVAALGPLGAPNALWPLALLGMGFTVFNEAAREIDLLDRFRHAGRAAIALAAAAAIAAALRRPAQLGPRLRRLEIALAGLVLPAAIGTLAYAARPLPADESMGGVLALAPHFAAEPDGVFAAGRERATPRVLLIGVDGASWERVEQGIAAGRLPSFARLVARGVHAPLGSAEPTYSPRLWTSIVTGVSAAQHGIEDFYLRQLPRLGIERLRLRRTFGPVRAALERTGELRFVPVTSSLRRRKAIWNLADEAGLTSAVVGLWATWPPEPLRNGVIVSDHASLARQQEWLDRGKASRPDAGIVTWPPELAERLASLQRSPDSVTREELAAFVAVDDALWGEFESLRGFSKDVPLSAFRSSHLNDAFHARAAEQIWRESRPDLLIVYLRAVDELSHFFYEAGVPEAAALGWSDADVRRYGGVVDNTYAWTDRALAPLVDEALRDGDTLVALVSDHGWEREPDGRYDHNDAPPGLLILAGAGVCRTRCPALATASIYDVAPTLLSRLGLPLSAELVGHPLDVAFAEPGRSARVAAYGGRVGEARAVASGSDGAIREKLEALGYVRE